MHQHRCGLFGPLPQGKRAAGGPVGGPMCLAENGWPIRPTWCGWPNLKYHAKLLDAFFERSWH